jgi:hypothetical protein
MEMFEIIRQGYNCNRYVKQDVKDGMSTFERDIDASHHDNNQGNLD